MGKGLYSGGHTWVTLSVDGTVWPTNEDDPAQAVVPKQAPRKRWDEAVVESDSSASGTRSDRKEAEFRILAECARAYREGSPPPPLNRAPTSLIEAISHSGGVIEWIAADSKRVKRFWEFVRQQDDRPPSARIVRPSKHKRGRSQ